MKALHDPRYIESIARLRAIRASKGLSQSELAKTLGKPQSYISKIETCERRIDFIELLTICKALGVSLRKVTPTEFEGVLSSE